MYDIRIAVESINWPVLAGFVGLAAGIGVLIYHVVAGYYHLRYYVWRRDEPEAWKCQPRRFQRPALHRNGVIVGTLSLTAGGVVTGILLYAIWAGLPTPIYYDVADYGWAYTIGSTIAYFVVLDLLAYYVHRALHIKWLFRRVHRYHHKFIATSPYTAAALHPVELFALQATSFAPVFLVPLHAVGIGVVLVYVLVFNIVDHSGVNLRSRIPWQPPSAYHDDHHAHFHCNFGQHLMIWDRLHGTLRLPGRTYGKHVFGGRGRADKERRNDDGFEGY